MTSSIVTPLNWDQNLTKTKNSRAKAFGNQSRSKNLKPKILEQKKNWNGHEFAFVKMAQFAKSSTDFATETRNIPELFSSI